VEVHGRESRTVVAIGIRSVDLILEARVVGLVACLAIVAIDRSDDSWSGQSSSTIDLIVIAARMDF
jgi:hypothetical protein